MRAAGFWPAAQVAGLGATGLLLAGLVYRPELALDVLWYGLIPVLPAVFLLSPLLWRNVCPLATVEMLWGKWKGPRALTAGGGAYAGSAGILLLFAMVPARRFLFNVNGPALAATVVAVALLALVLGRRSSMRAGFCNAICPVLPVERLYGQRPLHDAGRVHCSDCSRCTSTGCLDLAPTKSVAQVLGRSRKGHAWMTTPFGAFAAAFPGFIVAYFTLDDGSLATAGAVYQHVALGLVISFVATALLVRALKLDAGAAILLLGGVSVTLYYWLAAPGIVTTFGLAPSVTWLLRGLALGVVAVWAWKTPEQSGAYRRA